MVTMRLLIPSSGTGYCVGEVWVCNTQIYHTLQPVELDASDVEDRAMNVAMTAVLALRAAGHDLPGAKIEHLEI